MIQEQKNNLKKFIAALRSGKYHQIVHTLRRPGDNCMCAEGVLCDVYIKNNPNSPYQWADEIEPFHKYEFSPEGTFIGLKSRSEVAYNQNAPFAIRDWAGVLGVPVVAWNDKFKLTFSEIADRLEELLSK